MRVQLQWLHDTLQLAEEAGEFVHILGHVPPNTASCVYPWNREYDRIVRRFAHIITGQFFGHTHRDEFNVFYAEAGNSQSTAVNVAWNAGSGTTFVGFNSNYRLYYADNVDYVRFNHTFATLFDAKYWFMILIHLQRIVDHDTWIFNLTEANSHPDDSPKWFKEYSFKDAFDLPDLRPKTIGEMLQRWKGDTDQLKKVKSEHRYECLVFWKFVLFSIGCTSTRVLRSSRPKTVMLTVWKFTVKRPHATSRPTSFNRLEVPSEKNTIFIFPTNVFDYSYFIAFLHYTIHWRDLCRIEKKETNSAILEIYKMSNR